jgi:hypothetical protein
MQPPRRTMPKEEIPWERQRLPQRRDNHALSPAPRMREHRLPALRLTKHKGYGERGEKVIKSRCPLYPETGHQNWPA